MNTDNMRREIESLPAPAVDAARYREHIANFDLSEEQQNELLVALWNILVTFVDLGFGVDSVQRVLPQLIEHGSEATTSDDD